MDPVTGMALANTASGLADTLIGSYQTGKGNRILENTERPIQGIPEALQKKQSAASSLIGTNAPGYAEAIENVDANVARTMRAVRGTADSSQAALQGILSAGATAGDQYRSIDASNDAFEQNMINQYLSVLSEVGSAEMQAFDWNEKMKFLEATGTAGALLNAGIQNQKYGGENMAAGLIYAGLRGQDDLGTEKVLGAAKSSNDMPMSKTSQTPSAISDETKKMLENPIYANVIKNLARRKDMLATPEGWDLDFQQNYALGNKFYK